MVDLLVDSILTWMVKSHRGGKMHSGGFFRIEHCLMRWRMPCVDFSTSTGLFEGYDLIRDRGAKKPYSWWENHGATSPPVQQLAMRLLYQVNSSSCCERNLSTYGNLNSVKKSRLE